jgi:hypothetical protein
MLQGVEKLRLINESVNNLFVLPLPLEGPEETVPDDEDAGVVLVQAVAVRALSFLFKSFNN